MENVKPLKQASFRHNGKNFVTIEVSSGQIEIYDHYDDGMQRFMGYITDLSIPGILKVRATNALYSNPAYLDRNTHIQLPLKEVE